MLNKQPHLIKETCESETGRGAIAQLGERVLCKHEVVGSIPSGSTNLPLRETSNKLSQERVGAWHGRSKE